jgi:chromosome segregation ATPase
MSFPNNNNNFQNSYQENEMLTNFQNIYEKTNNLQQEKINTLEQTINDCKEELANYDYLLNENSQLNIELSKMYENLQLKNKIIDEFQKLSQISKSKFEFYINANHNYQQMLEKKNKKIEDLKLKIDETNKELIDLKNEHNKIINSLKEINDNNDKEAIILKEQLNVLQNNLKTSESNNEKIIKNLEEVVNENKILKEKLITFDKINEELTKLKSDFNELEKNLIEKNAKNEQLQNENEELKHKLEEINYNLNNLIANEKDLEEKNFNLNQLCIKYENAYNNAIQDLQKKNLDSNTFEKNLKIKEEELNKFKEKYNKKILKLKEDNIGLKQRENIYKDTLNKLKNYTNDINNNNNFNNIMNTQQSLGNNLNNLNNLNQSFYSYNPPRPEFNFNNNNEIDDSFKYSYYLIDNLKNAINKIDYQKDYSNLI